MEFDRLTQWIADTLSTDADDDTETTSLADHGDLNNRTVEKDTPEPSNDEFALFAATK